VDRRAFVSTVALGLLAAPLAVEAQPAGRVHRVGFLASGSPVSDLLGPDPRSPLLKAFLVRLRELGYVYEQSLFIEVRSAEERADRLPVVASELVRLKVDVIVTSGAPAARAAMEATSTIPIVISGIPDPVERGMVTSLARPGGNVTGLSSDAGPEIDGKRLELLKEAVPAISRVACIALQSWWDDPWGKQTQAAARALGVTLFHVEVSSPDRFNDAFATITRQAANALFVRPTPVTFAHRKLIIDFAAKHRLPAMYLFREYVEAGGLMAYGVGRVELYRRAAEYVDRVLKGARPAELPIERPTKFDLMINLRTAKALRLTIPQSLLLRADQVIE
jgi:putative ABC transport system substrate-binding protein